MARKKQTARMSTGGRPPRKQLPRKEVPTKAYRAQYSRKDIKLDNSKETIDEKITRREFEKIYENDHQKDDQEAHQESEE